MISGYIIVWLFVFALTILVIKNKGYKGIKKSGVFAGNQAIFGFNQKIMGAL